MGVGIWGGGIQNLVCAGGQGFGLTDNQGSSAWRCMELSN